VTPHIEDLVRDAQERIADRAVHPDRIRAGLPRRAARRARHRRYGVAGLAIVAVAVVAAVAAPLLVLGHGGKARTAPYQAGARASTSDTQTQSTGLAPVPMSYRPTWLPTGLTERIRWVPLSPATAESAAGVMRTWSAQHVGTNGYGAEHQLMLTVRHNSVARQPGSNQGVPVDINGKPGYYHGTAGEEKSYVEWRADPATILSVSQLRLGLSEADMLTVAKSVQPDTAQLRVPLDLGWLPNGLHADYAEVSGDSPTNWLVYEAAEAAAQTSGKESKEAPQSVSVFLSPTTTAPNGGQPLTVGGHPARVVDRTDIPNMRYLVVNLGSGKLLTVVAEWPSAQPLTTADMVKVAEHATPVTPADTAWIAR
jgi:hypothetical protein